VRREKDFPVSSNINPFFEKTGQPTQHCALSLLLCFVACTEPNSRPSPSSDTYPGDNWELYDPSETGMHQAGINSALNYAFSEGKNTQGVVIVRHGVVVGERYSTGNNEKSIATSWSTGKSIASALIGIAADQQVISSIDEPAANYLPEWKDSGRDSVTIRSLLEMRSGLVRQEGNDHINIYAAGGDQLALSLDRQINEIPRTKWVYRNEDSMLFAGILEEATDMMVGKYAEKHLFSKIGMKASWWTDTAGHALTYCCVDATTRDFARFGLLFARGGRWKDEQVISKSWVKESTTIPKGNSYYALQWWVFSEWGAIAALGLHENNIWVYPELDLVVVRNSIYTKIGNREVRTGNNYHRTAEPNNWNSDTFLAYILGAVTD
tara:strand:+ start:58022 stop:59161 length:1140 start_codon:yes stop_codon:yes gene_type:complete